MNNRQNGRRRRGGGNQPRPMGMQGNRLEVRVRGNAHQLLEKYKQLARDAHQAGDRVAAEYYLQHADHYFRVLNDSRIRQEEMRARRGIFDPLDEDGEEDEALEADPDIVRFDNRPARNEGRPAGVEERPAETGADREAGGRDPWVRHRDRPRPTRDKREDLRGEPVLSDGEVALAAFGGPPAPPPRAEEAAGAAADATPRPRRRTRTRRTSEAEPVEG